MITQRDAGGKKIKRADSERLCPGFCGLAVLPWGVSPKKSRNSVGLYSHSEGMESLPVQVAVGNRREARRATASAESNRVPLVSGFPGNGQLVDVACEHTSRSTCSPEAKTRNQGRRSLVKNPDLKDTTRSSPNSTASLCRCFLRRNRCGREQGDCGLRLMIPIPMPMQPDGC